MKKLLVLVEDYPNENKRSLMYIHTRNIFYKENGFDVKVLSFKTTENYTIDGVEVISLDSYVNNYKDFTDFILLCHAPNIKHHYKFLKKYQNRFKKIVFFFHGHEVLKVNKTYSKPYKFARESFIKKVIRNVYDDIKLYIWRKFFNKKIEKCYLIFVSKWMYDEFIKWVKIDEKLLEGRYEITYNGIGHDFENNKYVKSSAKKYDFITIRSNLDGSKYAVDIVVRLAELNPNLSFLLIGKGKFFNYFKKPDNLTWINDTLKHNQIVEYLNESKCALMPTRTDAQGLMMCEMASFGIPLITSKIPVCKEVFDGFENVEFIDNDNIESNDLLKKYNNIKDSNHINTKYYCNNTTKKEIEYLNSI